MSDLSVRLAALREPAPTSILPKVFQRTGLAHHFVVRPSPLGPVFVAYSRLGVTLLDLAPGPEDFATLYSSRFGRPALPVEEPPARLAATLERALTAGRTGKLPLDLAGVGPFQAAVLRKAAEIPPGEVRPYGWVAAEIGRPDSSRAVGNALATNPVPLVVPCHRVVRADGRLGRYSLGVDENKRRLLRAEGFDVEAHERLAARGVRYLGSATGRIYCHPSCRHARRITAGHRVEFRDAGAAVRAGYRPCRDCRPRAA
jgi:O-6-methylguanine DNA methyltransferase